MGAPVFSRRSFTWEAEILAIVVLIQEPLVSKFQGCKVSRWIRRGNITGGPIGGLIKVANPENFATLKP
jgi:hypothetical protein